jgi:hypothetical protein
MQFCLAWFLWTRLPPIYPQTSNYNVLAGTEGCVARPLRFVRRVAGGNNYRNLTDGRSNFKLKNCSLILAQCLLVGVRMSGPLPTPQIQSWNGCHVARFFRRSEGALLIASFRRRSLRVINLRVTIGGFRKKSMRLSNASVCRRQRTDFTVSARAPWPSRPTKCTAHTVILGRAASDSASCQ